MYSFVHSSWNSFSSTVVLERCVCVCGGSRWLASGERYVDVVVVYGESMRQLESDGGEVGEWLIS